MDILVEVPIVIVAHGTSATTGWSIAGGTGFATLAALDAGYYGKGIYFTSYVEYTIQYMITRADPAVLVTLLIPGNPYPATEDPHAEITEHSLLGVPIHSGYQSHYVVTDAKGMPFIPGEDATLHQKRKTVKEDDPTGAHGDDPKKAKAKKRKSGKQARRDIMSMEDGAGGHLYFDEFVVGQEVQCLPIYIVEFDTSKEHLKYLKKQVKS